MSIKTLNNSIGYYDPNTSCFFGRSRLSECAVIAIKNLYIYFLGTSGNILYRTFKKAGFYNDGATGISDRHAFVFFKAFGLKLKPVILESKEDLTNVMNTAFLNLYPIIGYSDYHVFIILPHEKVAERRVKFWASCHAPEYNSHYIELEECPDVSKESFCICMYADFPLDKAIGKVYQSKEFLGVSVVDANVIVREMLNKPLFLVKGININLNFFKKQTYELQKMNHLYQKHSRLRKKHYDCLYKAAINEMNKCISTDNMFEIQKRCYCILQQMFLTPIGEEYKQAFNKNLPMVMVQKQ